MANVCNFWGIVIGNPENVDKLFEIIEQYSVTYINNSLICGEQCVQASRNEIDSYEDGSKRYEIDGWCHNSISYSFVEVPCAGRLITIWEACKILNIDCEIYSKEPGMGFQEHYLFRNGILEKSDIVEWNEYESKYYESKSDMEDRLCISMSDNEWDECPVIQVGGFGNWEVSV